MNWKIKYWLVLCGSNLMLTLISAAAHAGMMTLFSFCLSLLSWHMAHALLKKEEKGESDVRD